MAASDVLKLQVLLGLGDNVSGPAKRISGSAQKTLSNIRDLGKQLKQLQGVADAVGKFRTLKRGLPDTAREAKQARQQLRGLQEQFNATAQPTKKLTQQLKRAETASASATQRFRQQANAVRELRTRMSAAGVATKKLRADESALGQRIDATNAAMKRQQAHLGELERREKRLAQLRERFHTSQQNAANLSVGGFAGLTAGRSLLRPITAAIKQGAQFQAQLRDQAITGDMSAAQEKTLGQLVRQQARKWGVDTTKIFAGSGQLVGAGLADQASLNRYIPLLTKLRVATNAEMVDLGNLTVALQQNLGINKEMAGTFDALAYAGKAGNFELKDMARWMPKLGAAMGAMGGHGKKAAAELAAVLQIARQGAGSADEAGNNVQNFLKKITAPVTKANFKKVGIDYEKELKQYQAQGVGPIEGSLNIINEYLEKRGAGKAFQGVLATKNKEERASKLQALSKSFGLGELFNDQQAMAAILPLMAHRDELHKIYGGSMAAQGTVDTDAAKRSEILARKWSKAKTNALDLAQTVSDILAPAVTKLLKWATQLAQGLQQWAKAHPTLTAVIVKLAAVVGVLLVVLGGLAIGIAGLMAPFALLNFGFGKMLLFMGKTSSGSKKLWGHLRTLGKSVAKVAGGLAKFAKLLAGGAWRALLKLIGGFKLIVRVIAVAGKALLANPILLLLGLLAVAAYLIWKNWKPIKAFFIDLWHSIVEALRPVTDWIVAAWDRVVAGLKTIWQFYKDFWGGLWDGIKAIVKSVIDWIGDKIDWVLNKWKDLKGLVSDLGKANQGVANKALQLATSTHGGARSHALGGAMLGLMAVTNPAALIAQQAAKPAAPVRAASAAGTSHTTINVHAAPGMDERRLAQEVGRQFDARDRRQAARNRSRMGDLE